MHWAGANKTVKSHTQWHQGPWVSLQPLPAPAMDQLSELKGMTSHGPASRASIN